jgi:ribosomal protein S18 acetylase RimI-like enzyme
MQHSTVGSLLRSTQALCGQLCRKETLEFGIAYYSDRFPALADANQFREVVIPGARQIPAAFEQAEDWFVSHGLQCRRWAPAQGQPLDDLSAFLSQRGFGLRRWTAMALVEWRHLDVGDQVRVVPARAARTAFRQTFVHAAGACSDAGCGSWADACAERLDDPQFDAVVALVKGQAAGRCALYQVGDFARVMELAVLSDFAGRKVENALVTHVLTLARRLAFRRVYAQIEVGDSWSRNVLQAAGFVEDGTITEFDRAS